MEHEDDDAASILRRRRPPRGPLLPELPRRPPLLLRRVPPTLLPHLSAANPAQATAKEDDQADQSGQADAAVDDAPDASVIRPLAKRFDPFLCRVLQLLMPLLRPNPSGTAGLDVRGVVLYA
ncbi:hypothetical protein ZWY2020_053586 [Hordeum vulgare]|nr:hypothetical protein ZWY2020_053586 [Hordeum vulgare]